MPDEPTLDRLYSKEDRDLLIKISKVVKSVRDRKKRAEIGRQMLRKLWPDDMEYISKTHWIRTKNPGEVILFEPNYAQRKFYGVIQKMREERRPVRIIIPKARQLGFSTFIQSFFLNLFDRQPYQSSLVISFDDPSAGELFQKSTFVYKNLWFPRELERDSKGVIEAQLPHGSSMFVRTAGNISAGRSQTFHGLHCSELAYWADAGETLLSALQSIPTSPETYVFFESTAKGAVGEFYEYFDAAEKGLNSFEPFFAPWYWDIDYTMEFPNRESRREFGKHLSVKDVEYKRRYELTLEQMRWRRWCIRDRCQGSLRRWKLEYPASAEECFMVTGSPVFNAEKIAELHQNATAPRWQGDLLLLKE